MKKVFFLLIIVASNFSFPQDMAGPTTVPKNVLSFESGAWHRGIIGIGYNRNIVINENTFASIHGSVGVGIGYEKPNLYTALAPSINLGKSNIYATLGFELKYTIITYFDGSDWFGTSTYEGIAVSPYVGLNYISDGGLNIKLQGGILYSINETPLSFSYYGVPDMGHLILPSIGISIGHGIGK